MQKLPTAPAFSEPNANQIRLPAPSVSCREDL